MLINTKIVAKLRLTFLNSANCCLLGYFFR